MWFETQRDLCRQSYGTMINHFGITEIPVHLYKNIMISLDKSWFCYKNLMIMQNHDFKCKTN